MDILYQQGPMVQVNAHDGSINCMAVHNSGSLLCLGKDDGAAALVELSDGFVYSPNMKVEYCQSSKHQPTDNFVQTDKANLVTMFDRETRREKVLENLAKEARIRKAATDAKNNGMLRTAVINVKMRSRLAKEGYDTVRERCHGKTREDEYEETMVREAEDKFFKSIQSMKDARLAADKPLFYSVQ